MDTLLLLQHTEIKVTFEKSSGCVRNIYQIPLFRELRFRVSMFALDILLEEIEKIRKSQIIHISCDHVLRTVYCLPCADELLNYHNNALPIPI